MRLRLRQEKHAPALRDRRRRLWHGFSGLRLHRSRVHRPLKSIARGPVEYVLGISAISQQMACRKSGSGQEVQMKVLVCGSGDWTDLAAIERDEYQHTIASSAESSTMHSHRRSPLELKLMKYTAGNYSVTNST